MNWSQADNNCKEQGASLVKEDSEANINALEPIHGGEAS